MKDFTRDELHSITRRARDWGKVAENPNWIRAYEDLANAANVLDAHIARSTLYMCPTCDKPIMDDSDKAVTPAIKVEPPEQ